MNYDRPYERHRTSISAQCAHNSHISLCNHLAVFRYVLFPHSTAHTLRFHAHFRFARADKNFIATISDYLHANIGVWNWIGQAIESNIDADINAVYKDWQANVVLSFLTKHQFYGPCSRCTNAIDGIQWYQTSSALLETPEERMMRIIMVMNGWMKRHERRWCNIIC